MLTDVEIAQSAKMKPIVEIAQKVGLDEDDLELYGKYKAKISLEAIKKLDQNEDGKLILVTAINPTPAGEGKTTTMIGLSQALAFIPGVSRSGVTITTARAMGVTREAATKYSFLLSTPIVFAATVLKFKDFVFSVPFIIGVLASFLVGLLVIKFLLKYIKKGSFKIFAVYRVIFGILIIIVAIIH